jgi:FAD/FMN-containing dehydrogenase
VYRADRAQFGIYLDGYHESLDAASSEMITEVYVPPERLTGFMVAIAEDLRRSRADVIYGTVRMIRADTESFLPWARGDWACVILNLHVRHDPAGLAAARRDFRTIIDRALERGGSFYLTYHRWASREQVLRGHPTIVEFLRAKREYDPSERFASDWYAAMKDLFRGHRDHVGDLDDTPALNPRQVGIIPHSAGYGP